MKQIKQDGGKQWQKLLKQDAEVAKLAKKQTVKTKATTKKSK